MRVVLQRVSAAHVTVGGEVIASIGQGVLLLVGVEAADSAADGEWLAGKIARLRIFPDDDGQMNRSVVDIAGELLVVSQFTLHASTAKGTRPSFNAAAKPAIAEPLYQLFINQLRQAAARPIATGRFGAMMDVTITNNGPVTLILDSKSRV
jgi:D-tyrosyl-tRNA(Tyr) deacylase